MLILSNVIGTVVIPGRRIRLAGFLLLPSQNLDARLGLPELVKYSSVL